MIPNNFQLDVISLILDYLSELADEVDPYMIHSYSVHVIAKEIPPVGYSIPKIQKERYQKLTPSLINDHVLDFNLRLNFDHRSQLERRDPNYYKEYLKFFTEINWDTKENLISTWNEGPEIINYFLTGMEDNWEKVLKQTLINQSYKDENFQIDKDYFKNKNLNLLPEGVIQVSILADIFINNLNLNIEKRLLHVYRLSSSNFYGVFGDISEENYLFELNDSILLISFGATD